MRREKIYSFARPACWKLNQDILLRAYLQEREMGRSPLVVKPEHLCRCITCNVTLKGANERRWRSASRTSTRLSCSVLKRSYAAPNSSSHGPAWPPQSRRSRLYSAARGLPFNLMPSKLLNLLVSAAGATAYILAMVTYFLVLPSTLRHCRHTSDTAALSCGLSISNKIRDRFSSDNALCCSLCKTSWDCRLFAPSLVWFIVSLSRSQISLSFQPLIPNKKKKTSSSEKPKFFQVLILKPPTGLTYSAKHTKNVSHAPTEDLTEIALSLQSTKVFLLFPWDGRRSQLQNPQLLRSLIVNVSRFCQQKPATATNNWFAQHRRETARDMGLWRRQQKCSEKRWEEPNAALAGPNGRAEFALRSLRAARLRHYSVVMAVVRKPEQKREKITNKQTLAARPHANPKKKREAKNEISHIQKDCVCFSKEFLNIA